MTIGRRIRQARGSKLTQTALAEELGVSAQTVSAWETGAKRPSAQRLEDITAACGVVEQFFQGCIMGGVHDERQSR